MICMTGESCNSVEEFLGNYPEDARVRLGEGAEMTITQALAFEKMFCPADPQKRQDPERRVAFLAGMLAAGGSLLPEHEYLVKPAE